MVTFTCQSCNSCLKKKAVQTHLFKCRSPQLTCIDCLKDFDSHSYVGHISCITEDQRYGGKDFTLSNAMIIQNQWNQSIKELLQRNLSPKSLKDVIVFTSENPCCPRHKKKFLNFVLNNKIFKSRELVEKAYNLIQEEFLKNNPVNDLSNANKDNDTLSGSKRKTISETEVVEVDDSPITTNKLSKKKNKKHNCENGEAKPITENGFTNSKKSDKKGKKSNLDNDKEDVCKSSENEIEKVNGAELKQNGHSHGVMACEGKKKKKNKKDRKNSSAGLAESENIEEILDDSLDSQENQQIELNGMKNNLSEIPKEDLSKLSKKERKKLLKQKKYEAEIVSIENYKKEDDAIVVEEETEKPKKKKKKQTEEEANRVQKNSLSEPEDKKIKLEVDIDHIEETVDVEKPKKFKWDEVIIQVLQSQSDGEMSLKRLSKKVCGEYTNVYGERESYEEIMLKFNKKVVRTHGVRVLKDRAKLLMDS